MYHFSFFSLQQTECNASSTTEPDKSSSTARRVELREGKQARQKNKIKKRENTKQSEDDEEEDEAAKSQTCFPSCHHPASLECDSRLTHVLQFYKRSVRSGVGGFSAALYSVCIPPRTPCRSHHLCFRDVSLVALLALFPRIDGVDHARNPRKCSRFRRHPGAAAVTAYTRQFQGGLWHSPTLPEKTKSDRCAFPVPSDVSSSPHGVWRRGAHFRRKIGNL